MCENLAMRAAQLVDIILQEAATGDVPEDALDRRFQPFIVSATLCVSARVGGLTSM